MQYQVVGGSLGVVAVLWAIVTTVFWMAMAYRAMKAHERIADAMEKFERITRPGGPA
jgi:hypothetical protein